MKIDFPCLETKMVDRELVIANDYNPNSVPKDKMKLLKQSIIDNGFCFPIAVIWNSEDENYVIIDGFHRRMMAEPEYLDLKQVPVVVLNHDIKKRMTATIQFNKARGVHEVDLDAEVIRKLIEQGMEEIDICKHLGIDPETLHRYKSLTGIAGIFKNVQYSKSWEVTNKNNSDE